MSGEVGGDQAESILQTIRTAQTALQQLEAQMASASEPGLRVSHESVEVAEWLLRCRKVRDCLFPAGLFADPAWDMLIDLYVRDAQRLETSVSSVCVASGVAASTAMRWLNRLVEEGLVERRSAPGDRRAIFVSLTDAGERLLSTLLKRVALPLQIRTD